MKLTKLMLYGFTLNLYEPFDALEMRSVKDNGSDQDIEWCNEADRDYYALYAHASKEDRWVSIADSPSKLELLELAQMFHVFSAFTLPLTTKFEI